MSTYLLRSSCFPSLKLSRLHLSPNLFYFARLPILSSHRSTSLYTPPNSSLISPSKRSYATLIDPSSMPHDVKPDILIIGSGGGSLVAALRAKSLNFNPLIIEKSSLIGGSTCYSGGGLWVPGNGLHPGVQDSVDEALLYMETLINPNYTGPASTRGRKLAFLENAPKMMKFLAGEGFNWVPSRGYPDYYPNLPGGKAGGRSIEGRMFDVNKLGKWKNKLNYNPQMPKVSVPMYTFEAAKVFRAGSSWDGLLQVLEVFGWRKIPQVVMGRRPITMGATLVGQLLYLNLQRQVPIWTEASLKEIVLRDGKVTGAVIVKDGKDVVIEAPKGVLLGAGGFARNKAMREKYQEHPITNEWTSTPPHDLGEAITAAMKIGAATDLLDDSWWGPTIMNQSNGFVMWTQYERAFPHSIVVDKAGNRFTNEAQSYTTFCHDQYKRNRTTSAIPAFMIMDQQHRKRYLLAGMMPGKVPQKVLDSGLVVKADTLEALAKKLGIDAEGLKKTVQRFNGMVAKGVDEDYKRGANAYDVFFGDPGSKYKKNPCLGTIEKPPFYACKIVPGDLGTKGGVVTDEQARVLKGDGNVIPNLYAFGNTSASVMGREYCGAGSTLGPALTFAYVAVNSIADNK